MAFCMNCGKQLPDGAKFCLECGTKLGDIKEDLTPKRETTYEGTVHKCPNCGDMLDAYESICETCGWERRGTKAAVAVKEFEERFLTAKTIAQKNDLIRTFAIPNTREDIREFIMLAVANIATGSDCMEAWAAKLEQAYQKAKLIFTKGEDLSYIEEMYKKAKGHLNVNRAGNGIVSIFSGAGKGIAFLLGKIAVPFKWFAKLLERSQGARVFFGIALGYGLLFGIIFGIPGCSHLVQNNKLEKMVSQVEEYISVGDYANAKLVAGQIIYEKDLMEIYASSAAKWDRIRNSLLIEIAEKQGLPKPTICVGTSSDDFEGMDYHDVEDQLRELGFSNIQTKSESNWFMKDYIVKEITINGSPDFAATDVFELDAIIVITYYE